MKIKFLSSIIFLLIPISLQAQTYGTANVSLLSTTSGVLVPNGLSSDGSIIFSNMRQQATVAPFCPNWVALWDVPNGNPIINNGDSVTWTVNVPQGPGFYHCVYNGTFKVYWNWFFMCNQYSISYSVTITYVSS